MVIVLSVRIDSYIVFRQMVGASHEEVEEIGMM